MSVIKIKTVEESSVGKAARILLLLVMGRLKGVWSEIGAVASDKN